MVGYHWDLGVHHRGTFYYALKLDRMRIALDRDLCENDKGNAFRVQRERPGKHTSAPPSISSSILPSKSQASPKQVTSKSQASHKQVTSILAAVQIDSGDMSILLVESFLLIFI